MVPHTCYSEVTEFCSPRAAAAPFSVSSTLSLPVPNDDDFRRPSFGVGGVIAKAEPGVDPLRTCRCIDTTVCIWPDLTKRIQECFAKQRPITCHRQGCLLLTCSQVSRDSIQKALCHHHKVNVWDVGQGARDYSPVQKQASLGQAHASERPGAARLDVALTTWWPGGL